MADFAKMRQAKLFTGSRGKKKKKTEIKIKLEKVTAKSTVERKNSEQLCGHPGVRGMEM